jgi:predicted lipoprotein
MDAKTSSNPAPVPLWVRLAVVAVLAGVGLWRFPLFHVVPLRAPASAADAAAAFDAPAFAARFWAERLQPACARATAAAVLVADLRREPAAAIDQHARKVGIGGTAGFFVRGEGRVVAVERNLVVLAIGDDPAATVALQTGPVFGNAVRDATGLIDVNAVPSLEAFNALSAELNRLVETRVQPALRERAKPDVHVAFAGCTEANEPVAGRPVLTLVPVLVEVR